MKQWIVGTSIHKGFFIFVAGFTGGVALHSFFNIGWIALVWLMFIAATALLFGVVRRFLTALLCGVFICGVAAGVARFSLADTNTHLPVMEKRVGHDVVVEGVVIDEPDERENHTRLTVEPITIEGEEVDFAYKHRILVVTDLVPEYMYGDVIVTSGILEKPENFLSETGREFNYVAFLQKEGIYYETVFPNIEKTDEQAGNVIRRALFSFKHAFLENIQRVIPEPQASLLGGIVVGAKRALGNELLDAFRATGIIHIVVLSGYNVTIVADALTRALTWLPLLVRLGVGAAAMLGFMVMVGAGATVVRATIMALLVVLARATGRTHDITIALIVAGFIMLMVNPRILIFDPSFQLSFLATLGLIYLAPAIEKYFQWVPTKLQLREFATATIATQLFVLPLLIYMMGEVSLVSLPVNMLILVFVPLTMLAGFTTGMIGFISTALSLPFAYVTTGLLSYELGIVNIFNNFSLTSVSVPSVSFLWVVAWYGLYGMVFYALYRKKKNID